MADRTRELSTLLQVDRAMSQDLPLPGMMEEVLGILLDALKADRGAFHILANDGTLELVAHRGLSPELNEALAKLKPGEGAAGQAALQRRVVTFDMDHYPTDRLAQAVRGQGIQNIAGIPILVGDKLIGALVAARSRRQPFTSRELALLGSVATQTGIYFERARLQKETEQQKARLQQVMDTVTDGIVLLDADHRVLLANPTGRERLRLLAASPPGEPLTRLARHPVERLLSPSPMVLMRELESKGPPRRVFEVHTKPVEQAGNKGWVMVLRDITQRKQAEETLKHQEQRYRTTLDEMMEGCQIIGFDWRYVYVNEAAARHGRHTREELLGHTMMEIYPGIESAEMFSQLQRCMNNRTSHRMENEFTYPDGSKSWFELSIQPVPEGIFILSLDITERKKAIEFAELSKLKTNLLSTVSHELRTPLATIKGYATLILDYDKRLKSNEKREHLKSIETAADRLTELVDHLLDMSRLEAGITKLEKAPTEVAELVGEAVAEAQLRAPGHKIETRLEEGLPLVTLDARRVRQVLDNIVDNAIKYSKEATRIVVAARLLESELLIRTS